MRKALLTVLPLLLVVAPAPAAAGKWRLDQVRVRATAELTYTTTWTAPAAFLGSDCFHRKFNEGSGGETLTLKTRRPVDLTFNFEGGVAQLTGASDGGFGLAEPLVLHGQHARRSSWRSWSEPGACGGEHVVDPPPETDCGMRLPIRLLSLVWNGKLHATVTRNPDQREAATDHFKRCEVLYPEGDAPGESLDLRPRPLSARTVKGSRTFSVRDSQSWSSSAPSGARALDSSSKLVWKVTFRRVALVKSET